MSDFFGNVRDGLAMIGLGAVVYAVHLVWRALREGVISAQKSNKSFKEQEQPSGLEKPQNIEAIGVEVPWPSVLSKKK